MILWSFALVYGEKHQLQELRDCIPHFRNDPFCCSLKLYTGAAHNNAAQKPEAWTLD